ncbi:hypothetical protein OsI_27732 [Oryza sativa Indica Group]|uniref:Uncharacterized protein n=2 Tax=Oryza sativa TaxID=4530 RepID=B9FYZ0_ORYSJ|nr:hypothetical protein OsI_27732 [Oryza sativa Indica Group]EEE68007.1 hypothetical protein OsJ_25965 [Oryza sativa Japonica Group]
MHEANCHTKIMLTVVQLSVFQAIVWFTLLLFVLEVRKAAIGMYVDGASSSDESSSSSTMTPASRGRRGQRWRRHIHGHRRHRGERRRQAVAVGRW